MSKTAYKGRHRRSSRNRRSRINRNRKSIRGGMFGRNRNIGTQEKIARLERKVQPATRRSPLRFLRERGYMGRNRQTTAENKRKQRMTELDELKKQQKFQTDVGNITKGLNDIQNKQYATGLDMVKHGINGANSYVDSEYANSLQEFDNKYNDLSTDLDKINGDAIEELNRLGGHVDEAEVDKVLAELQIANLPSAGKKQLPRGTRGTRGTHQ